jgi:hypothetical protein
MLLIGDSWAFAFASIGAAGSIATAGAIFFLWTQAKHTQEQLRLSRQQISLIRKEMDSTLRPWLGFSEIKPGHNGEVLCRVKNYGRIPAEIIKRWNVLSREKISREIIQSTKVQFEKLMVFPDATINMNIENPDPKPDLIYVGVLIEYNYADNKFGEYCIIAKLVTEKNEYQVQEVFAN